MDKRLHSYRNQLYLWYPKWVETDNWDILAAKAVAQCKIGKVLFKDYGAVWTEKGIDIRKSRRKSLKESTYTTLCEFLHDQGANPLGYSREVNLSRHYDCLSFQIDLAVIHLAQYIITKKRGGYFVSCSLTVKGEAWVYAFDEQEAKMKAKGNISAYANDILRSGSLTVEVGSAELRIPCYTEEDWQKILADEDE